MSGTTVSAGRGADGDRDRFAFGENWARFLRAIDEERILSAEVSLCRMLGRDQLDGCRVLDIGCGSGLFSLAARRLGATVHAFDYDPASVRCTAELKRRYFPDDDAWTVEQGSILDSDYVARLGTFDVVYAWGVLHHTGAMWRALDQAASLVRDGGHLFVALYNDQGRRSVYWTWVKRAYIRLPRALRGIIVWPAFVRLWGRRLLRDTLRGRPMRSWRSYREERGMSPWRDVVDWVGGYPFEVATPDAVLDACRQKGYVLVKLRTCGGGNGCNEYVFERTSTRA